MLFPYRILISGLVAWWLAQTIKVPIEYLVTHRWNWSLWFSAGGMPSSHTALVTGMMFGIGFFYGFDTPVFALSVALVMIVVYDAAGVRRQAGIHAQRINVMINELLQGHPVSEKQLKEVLGHTPAQVLVGSIFGFATPYLIWLLWR